MIILAIETSTSIGSVAIIDDDKLVAEYTIRLQDTHSEKLLTIINTTLLDCNIKIEDIDGIAVTIGPGSFTGLRVGLSTVKGLAYSTNKPVVTVSTLKALAMNVYYSKYLICPMLDARKKEVFTALYRFNEDFGLDSLRDECAISPKQFIEGISDKTIFLGDGVDVYSDIISTRLGSLALFAPLTHRYPKASNVAKLSLSSFMSNDTADVKRIVPKYHRLSEAEIKWKNNKKVLDI